jgi:hypothetical protein
MASILDSQPDIVLVGKVDSRNNIFDAGNVD